jgi:hypothetical protein
MQGTCFKAVSCAAGDTACLSSAVKNAKQPVQAESIIASALVADQGKTGAYTPGAGAATFLTLSLSAEARQKVADVIDETVHAIAAGGYSKSADEIKHIEESVSAASAPCDESDASCTPIASAPPQVRATSAAQSGESRVAAQISCAPQVADLGMRIGIAYGCVNATKSVGEGFDTNGTQWGAVSAMLPSINQNGVMTYGLSCEGATKATATCSVDVNKPVLLLTSSDSATGSAIAWVTGGMSTCTLDSDDVSEIAALKNGIGTAGVVSLAPGEHGSVSMRCITRGGDTRESSVTLGS